MNKTTKLSWLLLLVVAVFARGSILAQESAAIPGFRFEPFKLPAGELGNHVQTIVQDSSGFIWFGSQYGLHRWDGYQFKTFLSNSADPYSISSNYVEYIYVAKDGSLWLGTWGGGLNHFDPETQRFTHYLYDSRDPESLSNNYISQIVEDREGFLWIATQYGLNRLDRKTGTFKRFLHDPSDSGSLSYDKCRTLFVDSGGVLWVGTGWPWEDSRAGGLNRYHSGSGKFTRYLHNEYDSGSLISNKVTEISEDSRGNFWVGTDGDGLHLMDRKTGKFTRLTNPANRTGLSTPRVGNYFDWHTRFVFEDRQKKLWIGSWRGGIKYYDPLSGAVRHFKATGKGTESIPDDFVWMMFQSKDGTFWGCTAGPEAQVFKIREEKSAFHIVGLAMEDYAQSFCESRDGKLWVGTRTLGLTSFDPKTCESETYRNDPKRPVAALPRGSADQFYPEKKFLFDNIWKIIEDRSGNLWLGKWMQNAGLMRFNPNSGELLTYRHDSNNCKSLGSDMVMDIVEDRRGRLWVATANGDLNCYHPGMDGFERFPASGKPELTYSCDSKGQFFFSKLALARDGSIWIAASGGDKSNVPLSLSRFNPESKTFQSFDLKLAPNEVVNPEWVNGLVEDKEGNIWVNTEHTLRKINPKSGISTAYSAQFLGSSMLRGMTIDKQGTLWLSGDGIISFNPANGAGFLYQSNSGIITAPFHWRSAYQNSKGRLFFGGRGGFQYFDPGEIGKTLGAEKPDVLITDFKLFDKSVKPGEKGLYTSNIWDTREIHLSYDQDIFSFQFAALDFQFPEGNRHKYKLEGYDQDWRMAGLEPVATYVKVPPGTYTFRVQAANRNGVWGEEKTIRVLISAPWWATWWAYTLYTAFALGILYAFYHIQLKRRLDQAEALRLKDLDVVKTKLYTNITHEFRTPLTVILGLARQGMESPEGQNRNNMEMIARNGQHLLDLVNQMLDLAKLESGKMDLHFQQGDVVNYLKYLVESFHSFAESRGVQLHFLSDLEALTMDYDPERLQQVVSNLLSNAVKFTPTEGHVYVDLRIHGEAVPWNASINPNAPKPQIQIRVRDTGIGIPEAVLPNIFDRFYQVDDTPTRQSEGSGIGLSLTKELVKLMHGDITAKSQAGKGAEFTVTLPVHTQAETVHVPSLTRFGGKYRPEPTPGHQVSVQGEGPITLLLAEDNPDVVAYLASCLPEYRLLVGKDGQEAIEIALEHIPDLVITDVMMPRKDGFEVCRTLKSDERTSHIPVIMLTAKADMESKLEGLEYGADAYLAKPFHKEELLLRLRKLLELRRELRRHYLAVAGLAPALRAPKSSAAIANAEDQFVQKVREAVEARLDDPGFDVEQLCRKVAMSHSQLHRKLSALTGFAATRFIRHVRLNKARELLQNQDLSITSIAFDTGFNDPSYFSRVFRQEFGVTPQEWRERECQSVVQ